MKPPCGNEDCDACYPIPRWKISTESVRRILHSRTIKARTQEEALAIYAAGTAWPSSYDERDLEVIVEGEPVVEIKPPRASKYDCWHLLGEEPVDGVPGGFEDSDPT